MRVALAGDWFLPRLGGIELQMRDLALRLRARGHDVEVITPVPGPETVDGIGVHRLGVDRLPGAGIVCTAEAFRRIRGRLERGRYDVVHVHFGIIAPAAYAAAFHAQRLGIRTVATFHSVLRHFEVPMWLVRGAMGVSNWRVKWSAVSSVVAESMRPLVGDSPVALLPNAVEPEFWRNGRSTRPQGTGLRAVSVMRLHARKRPRALLRAFAALAHDPPGAQPPTLRIVGDGGERRLLDRIVSRQGLQQVVTLTRWLPREAVRDELHGADVFLLPSVLEAYGIAALEARCAGLPVIAMRASGARDFLTDGEDALLADSDAELTEHVRRFARDAALRERLTRGASVPPPGVDWDSAVERVERLYLDAGAADGRDPGHELPPAPVMAPRR